MLRFFRGDECFEKLKLADEVILEADKTIFMAKIQIDRQGEIIGKQYEQIQLYKENEKLFKKKQSTIRPFLKGVGVGVVLTFLFSVVI
jgi:hypothetical protein